MTIHFINPDTPPIEMKDEYLTDFLKQVNEGNAFANLGENKLIVKISQVLYID